MITLLTNHCNLRLANSPSNKAKVRSLQGRWKHPKRVHFQADSRQPFLGSSASQFPKDAAMLAQAADLEAQADRIERQFTT
jgi:hypothetical protein